MNILKVSSKSSANSVAGALAAAIRDEGQAEIQAVGAGAVNQSVKAIHNLPLKRFPLRVRSVQQFASRLPLQKPDLLRGFYGVRTAFAIKRA